MSSRLHNKWHRHNHHTTAINDPNFPDAAHDPIASPEAPFQGAFVIQGPLSAYQSTGQPTGYLAGPDIALALQSNNLSLSGNSNAVIDRTLNVGEIFIKGIINEVGTYKALTIDDSARKTYNTPVEASGSYLIVNVGGVDRAIRLWNIL